MQIFVLSLLWCILTWNQIISSDCKPYVATYQSYFSLSLFFFSLFFFPQNGQIKLPDADLRKHLTSAHAFDTIMRSSEIVIIPQRSFSSRIRALDVELKLRLGGHLCRPFCGPLSQRACSSYADRWLDWQPCCCCSDFSESRWTGLRWCDHNHPPTPQPLLMLCHCWPKPNGKRWSTDGAISEHRVWFLSSGSCVSGGNLEKPMGERDYFFSRQEKKARVSPG